MRYGIHYSCWSHIGKRRRTNQDNYICDGNYMARDGHAPARPLTGVMAADSDEVMGIFDGMGGEECGAVAAYIAAENASGFRIGHNPVSDLKRFCMDTNEKICNYAEKNGVFSMGTTAAVMAFSEEEIAVCNIGDSKIFYLNDSGLEQISRDHYAYAAPGRKPPLSQNLGIPPEEMLIDPYVASRSYQAGDTYLICSDGLTDMVTVEEMNRIIAEEKLEDAVNGLMERALANGGRDNVTILLCRVEAIKDMD